MATISRGSEWRKWDLHVHTPHSLFHNYQAKEAYDVWERYIKELESLPTEFKVLGINDYLFIDGYKKILDYKSQGRLENIDLILPVIELRLAKFCGSTQLKRINFHVIFSNEISPDIIQSQFLNGLSAKYKLDPNCNQQKWGGIITRDNLEALGKAIKESVPQDELHKYDSELKEGFNNLNLEIDSIFSLLRNAEQYFSGKYLTCIGKTEWDSLNWNDNSIAEKKTIINSVDIVFTASESIEKFNNAKSKLIESKVNSLLLDCSDAHNNIDSFDKDRIGNCNTWIKANPTFEGLKQILFEPDERVKIQETKPEEKSVYQVIDSVILKEKDFWDETIHFNENLNTIIGGRSTGKSTLLKAIAKKINNKIDSEDEFVKNHLSGVAVKWKDCEETASRDIDFFPQSYMYEIAKDEKKTNKLIQDIIRNRDENEILEEYKSQNENLKKNITKSILDIFQMQSDIESLQEQLKEKGDKKGVEAEIERLNTKINELSKNSQTSENELSLYRKLLQDISESERLVSQADSDLKLFERMKIATPINNSYPTENGFDKLSFILNQDELNRHFKNLTIKTEKEWLEIVEGFVTSTANGRTQNISKIEDVKKNGTYIKCTKYYNDNKELSDVQHKLKEENKKLQEISQLEKQITSLNAQKDGVLLTIVENHLSYKTNTENIVKSLSIEFDGVKITLKMNFQKENLKNYIESRLNQRGNERQNFIDTFINQYESKTSEQSKIFLSKALNKEIDYKNYNTNQNVANELYTTNWFDISYELSYQDDTFAEMSEGKQAFVILKLLLDFSTKKCPILIDQPEDSLDNRAIYNELVQYLKIKKKERQIILVTHNPNVVVSADAENVIVANQNGNDCLNIDNIKFQYINGALEDTKAKDENITIILQSQGVREHVCEILEGGREAFEKREKKYGFKK
jgi:predicted ATPase